MTTLYILAGTLLLAGLTLRQLRRRLERKIRKETDNYGKLR